MSGCGFNILKCLRFSFPSQKTKNPPVTLSFFTEHPCPLKPHCSETSGIQKPPPQKHGHFKWRQRRCQPALSNLTGWFISFQGTEQVKFQEKTIALFPLVTYLGVGWHTCFWPKASWDGGSEGSKEISRSRVWWCQAWFLQKSTAALSSSVFWRKD